jgi:hypothetical protein
MTGLPEHVNLGAAGGTRSQPATRKSRAPLAWLEDRWVEGAGFLAVGALALAPLMDRLLPAAILLIFLHLPAWMVHQVEEHAGDRFRRAVNRDSFGGLDVITREAVLAINVPLVWGVNLGALYAAVLWEPGCGLVAPYALLINALIHVGAALRQRAFNPGLLTALVVFLPLALGTLYALGGVDLSFHIVGFLLAAIIHLLVVLYLLHRLEALRAGPPHAEA